MSDTHTLEGIAALSHLGVIRARGDDAVPFLQGQLTNDVAGLGLSEARLAGYCSAKGRLLAELPRLERSRRTNCCSPAVPMSWPRP